MSFEIGETIRLNSGGPVMTVIDKMPIPKGGLGIGPKAKDRQFKVAWFVEGELKSAEVGESCAYHVKIIKQEIDA